MVLWRTCIIHATSIASMQCSMQPWVINDCNQLIFLFAWTNPLRKRLHVDLLYWRSKTLTIVWLYTPRHPNNGRAYLQIWAVVFGDIGAVTLAEHRDLLLNVLDLIFRLLQVDDLDGHHLFSAIVDALVDLTERPLPNALLFCEILLRVKPGILLERETAEECYEIQWQM